MGFFVDRPVFATVIALIISLVGLLTVRQLAIEQYPNVAPPQIQISANYPGASPEILETTVAAPLEREMSGVEGLLYTTSSSTANGTLSLSVYFEPGVNLDIAEVNVNNRVKRVEPLLPQEVLRQGLRVEKTNPSLLLVIGMQSDDPQFDAIYVANLANSQVINEIKRLPGAGDVTLFAFPYAMRIWIDPDALYKYKVTVTDIVGSVSTQNQNFPVGVIGSSPSPRGQVLTFPVQTTGSMTEISEFEEIIVKALPDGAVVRVRDLGRVELGAEDYSISSRINQKDAVAIGVYLRPGANALSLAKEVRVKMADLQRQFPSSIKWSVPYDTTRFVTESIDLVKHTFIEAFVLVLIIVYLFLGSIRATFICLIAIPVSIIGTFAGMLMLGFSINMLTLFGLVLAIGIVVDDAIVVVEAVEQHMHDEHLEPKAAARKAMKSIGGAIVGVTAVICAVFVPIAFMPGVTGTLYKQFAMTITISTLLSALVALTLTPAMCGLILKSGSTKPKLIAKFDTLFDRVTQRYALAAGGIMKRWFRFLLIYGLIIAALLYLFKTIPTGFVPEEDKGAMFIAIDLPSGASAERTLEVLKKVEKIVAAEPTVENMVALNGFSIFYNYANQGFVFATLKDWKVRSNKNQQIFAILQRMNQAFSSITEARVFALNEPPISGMGSVAGFDYRLISLDGDRTKLEQTALDMVAAANLEPALFGVRNVGAPQVQTLFLDVDRNKARALGVSLADLYSTIGGLLGSTFINQFTLFGTNLKVILQSEAESRGDPSSLKQFYVRSGRGDLVPIGTLARSEWRFAPIALPRYNGYPSVQLNGTAAPGRSTGEALDAMERLSAEKLPEGLGYQWSGQSLQERAAGAASTLIFALSIIFVFLFLAALYESWTLPIAVFLVVPIGILGALVALLIRGTPNDVFFQVSLITLVGLAGKNGILIVEFAKQRYEEGATPFDAAVEAGRLRLRPIMMTSLAFITGTIPLVIASGAGAATQHSVGTGIMGGMMAATLIGVFFTPLFFFLATTYMGGKRLHSNVSSEAAVVPVSGAETSSPTPVAHVPPPEAHT